MFELAFHGEAGQGGADITSPVAVAHITDQHLAPRHLLAEGVDRFLIVEQPPIYIYICMVYIHTYIYVYIHRGRESTQWYAHTCTCILTQRYLQDLSNGDENNGSATREDPRIDSTFN